jgi:hypothetical protein
MSGSSATVYPNGVPARVRRAWPGLVAAVESCGNITASARAVGLSRRQVYSTCATDPDLKERLDEARDLFVDRLESKANELALAGDSRLLIELLRANRPEKFGWRGAKPNAAQVAADDRLPLPEGNAERALQLIEEFSRHIEGG